MVKNTELEPQAAVIDQAEREHQRRMELERSRLELERSRRKYMLWTAILSALITGIFGLAIELLKHIGSNVNTDKPTGSVNDIRTGVSVIVNVSQNEVAAKAAVSPIPVTQPASTPPVATTRPSASAPASPLAPIIPVDAGTSKEVLERCTGFEPLTPTRVTVERTTDGYTAAIDLKNPTDQVVAVFSKWGGAPFTLTTAGQTVTTQSNIRDEGKFTFFHGATPDQWDGAFKSGPQVDPQGSMHIQGHFAARMDVVGTSASLSMTLLYLYKDGAGAQLLKTRTPQCSALPISDSK